MLVWACVGAGVGVVCVLVWAVSASVGVCMCVGADLSVGVITGVDPGVDVDSGRWRVVGQGASRGV